MNMACDTRNLPKGMSEAERQRAIQANKVYCKACEENGIKICSWDNFSAWREYVDGKINEPELIEKVEYELKEFTQTFEKYTLIAEEDSTESVEEELYRERARQANKIYRKACTDSGMNLCFFNSFATWNDYVYGRLSEAEFAERATIQARQMSQEAPKE